MPRMKGGAVNEERSPLKDAIDCEGLLVDSLNEVETCKD